MNYAPSKSGPSRKLSLETRIFLVLMKLRLDLLQTDLAYRFDVSPRKVPKIFNTWIKLILKQLGVLIIWPSKSQVRKTLSQCFNKLYCKLRTTIDCTEICTENHTSLDSHCLLWSDYKHRTTIKILICIAPNGVVSWVSPAYGGRTSDAHIVRKSGFLDLLEPYDLFLK